MAELPTGTVTFLFTDIEGSTRLWEEHPEAMHALLARHDDILRRAIESHSGYLVKTTGDGVHAAFGTPADGASAAIEAQRMLRREAWGPADELRVRMALHTGAAEVREGDYYGSVLNRAARLMQAAHGGQLLLSDVTWKLVRDALPENVDVLDLGTHRLRDLSAPLGVFQVVHPELVREFPPPRSVDAFVGNLPQQVSSFVGRTKELERVRELLMQRRLLTITGVGGVGKTRLALQAAADALPSFPGGAWLVELARSGAPGSVAALALVALGAPPQPGESDIDVVCGHLANARAMLVVDNCEHVLDAAADLIASVLDRCPEVVVLATSREPLDLDGEQVVPVRPLDATSDAVSLFVERARSTDPDFVLDEVSAQYIGAICRRLDGLPLAIELAATRIDGMSIDHIASALDDRFRLLSSGRRRSVDRHQTLRATLEWSYLLLSDDEKLLLRRLGVFAGGFTLEVARSVCMPDYDVMDFDRTLASLVRKSLVQFERDPQRGRYRLLETVRVFALEHLGDAAEAGDIGRAHAQWIASMSDHPFEEWMTEGRVDRHLLIAELDNWREAVSYSLAAADPVLALRLTVHDMGPDLPETAAWTEAALNIDAMTDVPGWHWLHHTLGGRAAAAMDLAGLERHIEAFDDACSDERDRAWSAPYRAVRATLRGDDDPVDIVEAALSTPGLSNLVTAYLHTFRGFYRNLPPRSDPAAARLALELCVDANFTPLAIPQAFLAMALREEDPNEAVVALQRAEQLALEADSPFVTSTVVAWGSLALLALPDDIALGHLRDRLDRLQPHWNTSAAALLALCVAVLRRFEDPVVAPVARYLRSAPGGAFVLSRLVPDVPVESEPLDVSCLTLEEIVDEVRIPLARASGAEGPGKRSTKSH